MRRVYILSGVLLVVLLATYWFWTHPKDESIDEDKVPAYVLAEGDLLKVLWKRGEDLTVEVEKRTDASGDWYWASVSERKEVKPQKPEEDDSGAEEAPPPEPTFETKASSFQADEDAEKLFKAFSPWRAVRELDAAQAQGLDLGLDTPYATMELQRRNGNALVIEVGNETYGGRQRYARVEGKIFLAEKKDFGALDNAKSQLLERKLYPKAKKELDRVTISREANTRTYVQKNKDDPEKAFWTVEGGTDEEKVVATWLSQLFQLTASDYVAEAEVDPATLSPSFTFLVSDGSNEWSVEVLKTAEEKATWYARSPYNHGLVKLNESKASNLADDLDVVLPPPG